MPILNDMACVTPKPSVNVNDYHRELGHHRRNFFIQNKNENFQIFKFDKSHPGK